MIIERTETIGIKVFFGTGRIWEYWLKKGIHTLFHLLLSKLETTNGSVILLCNQL